MVTGVPSSRTVAASGPSLVRRQTTDELMPRRANSGKRERFRSVSTGEVGRNLPGQDFMQLNRVPVRRTDPDAFFAAKLSGDLGAERAYSALVEFAKSGLSAVRQVRRRASSS